MVLGVALLRSSSCEAAFLRLGVMIGSLALMLSCRDGVSGVGCFGCSTYRTVHLRPKHAGQDRHQDNVYRRCAGGGCWPRFRGRAARKFTT